MTDLGEERCVLTWQSCDTVALELPKKVVGCRKKISLPELAASGGGEEVRV